MTNPFDDENGRFLVLRNAERYLSLWPAFAGVPDGWTVVHEEDSRRGCLEYVERHWTEPPVAPRTSAGDARPC